MNPKLIDVLVLMKTSFRSCFKSETYPLTQQNENKIAYECKANENLNEQHISFLISKTIRKVTAQQLFKLFYFFANRNK